MKNDINYPDGWDTMAYPTEEDARRELRAVTRIRRELWAEKCNRLPRLGEMNYPELVDPNFEPLLVARLEYGHILLVNRRLLDERFCRRKTYRPWRRCNHRYIGSRAVNARIRHFLLAGDNENVSFCRRVMYANIHTSVRLAGCYHPEFTPEFVVSYIEDIEREFRHNLEAENEAAISAGSVQPARPLVHHLSPPPPPSCTLPAHWAGIMTREEAFREILKLNASGGDNDRLKFLMAWYEITDVELKTGALKK